MSDEYSNVARGKLKLKNDAELTKKKKKSKKNKINKSTDIGGNSNDDKNGPLTKRQRPATKAFNEDNKNEQHQEPLELLTRISTEKNLKNSLESNTEVAETNRRFTKAELAFKQQQQAMVSDQYYTIGNNIDKGINDNLEKYILSKNYI